MKKKMAAVMVLLLATFMTLYSVSGTYAKYTSTATGSDSARVAKWDVNTTNVIKDLFATSYNNVKVGTESEGVIAPGTSGSYSFTLGGTVETAYNLKVTATGTDEVNGAVTGYNPIKYSFKKNSDAATENLTFAELTAKINAIDDGTTDHTAGDLPTDTYTIGWTWDFDASGAGTNDAKDTELGKLVASGDKKISLTVTVTATQVN